MLRKWFMPALAIAVGVIVAAPASAQTGMIRGKVVDAEGKPAEGVAIAIEFGDGVTRKFEVKTDRRGEFIQIGLAPGNYKVTATHEKLGTQSANVRVNLSKPVEANFAFVPAREAQARLTWRRRQSSRKSSKRASRRAKPATTTWRSRSSQQLRA